MRSVVVSRRGLIDTIEGLAMRCVSRGRGRNERERCAKADWGCVCVYLCAKWGRSDSFLCAGASVRLSGDALKKHVVEEETKAGKPVQGEVQDG